MTQQDLLFDGATFDPELDAKRLTCQLQRVFQLMKDGEWRSLAEIQEHVGGSEAGISARLRDIRKPLGGSYTVERRRRGEAERGLFEYRVLTGKVYPD